MSKKLFSEKKYKISVSEVQCPAEFFTYCSYYKKASLRKKMAVHIIALTNYIAYMQTKMAENTQNQLSRVQLEVQKNLKK